MKATLKRQRVILQFYNTVFTDTSAPVTQADEVNLSACAGDLILIRMARLEQTIGLADACAGIIQPRSGAVRFLGRNWPELPPDQAHALRGRIGRVFKTGNWINHLSVMDNVLLSQRHHTRRSVRRLRDEAGELSQQFGLPGLPLNMPGDLTAADLQRAACVRAFLGRPLLILLEEPTAGIFVEIISALMHAVRDARDRGAAVIWLTQKGLIWHDQTLPATQRYRLIAGKLMEVTR
ncbi:MAG: ATP-binding cassette domain-containing protein [Deltaproteobacteria bacterium]|jgi:phospholipid/cholesterol/gamma-HCH transport system ATP-binding protein|nr:ATP-binding cassette domain-containing protein [Deltaproteobacteria bacterium]MBW2467869.1 ATP-binding cassette domain-containing protein [Deltaproteobacteria bacterium]MBW2486736.1 ATP-binding cassette domain-containing protein [Deltaproteobacteria bacterium]MBW2518165.1 ATP-binding cassette domain-containing protein [Deltaproteobacteria bacterium]